MANELMLWDVGFMSAARDLSDAQYRFVTISAEYVVDKSGGGESIFGVLQNKPIAEGRACEIRRLGVTKIVAGGEIVAGNKLKSDSVGRAVAASTNDLYGGVCLEGATVDLTATMIMEIGTM